MQFLKSEAAVNVLQFALDCGEQGTLYIVLGDLMNGEKPQMLYVFMQFLKSEAAVNVLQFALDCGEQGTLYIVLGDLMKRTTDVVRLYAVPQE